MKIFGARQVVAVKMPRVDLLLLLASPEFKDLVQKSPHSWAKAQLVAEPYTLYLHRTLVPLVLETSGGSIPWTRLRESLRARPPLGGKIG